RGRARLRHQRQLMPLIERAGRTVHFTRTGEGPGVVLVPGLGSGARLFGTLPRRFAREGFTCCAIDPVGLEPSSPLPGSIFDFQQAALDVLAIAAELPRPVTLIGTSLGGKVALQAAAMRGKHADRLVMLCSAARKTPRSRRVYRMFELLCTEVDGRLLGDLLAPLLFGATFHNDKPGVVADIIRSTKPSPASRAFMAAQAHALQAFDGAGLCAQVTWPTLCLSGAEDVLTLPGEVAATAALIAGAVHECIPGAGHSLLLESAAAFDRVIAFVRG
ncbi:MAG: alpha/beta hydrolase, partial [Planctomycetes bacterium]|nr:alpha/beta hydrolase [Planctomycetota bacterium]